MQESLRLKDLVLSVRGCKTAAEEREVITKECANIRDSFHNDSLTSRHRNVAKLLFISMMGYPTQFGQIECLKLIASKSFKEKRVGYLGLTQLLNEQDDVLLMVTNIMQLDINSNNVSIAGAALTAMANIANADMCRDLCKDICKLMTHSHPYIRKKAVLAGVKIAKKCPELSDSLCETVKIIIEDKSHVVVMNAAVLITEVLAFSPNYKKAFEFCTVLIIKALKNLMHSVNISEYSIGGVVNPFLQVRLIRLLGLLSENPPSQYVCDCLAYVFTNIEIGKNPANAVLYECVRTIIRINPTTGLKVLSANIMGRFLLNSENNLKYVALNTLSKFLNIDETIVQRHKITILGCLKDSDIIIKKQALNLISQLINETNFDKIIKELIDSFIGCEAELKEKILSILSQALEKYGTNKEFTIDKMIQVLTIAGNYVSDEFISAASHIISSCPELFGYSVHKLYRTLCNNTEQLGLVLLAVWCIGEFGELLVKDFWLSNDFSFPAVNICDVVSLLKVLLESQSCEYCKEFVLTSLVKLAVKIGSCRSLCRDIIETQTKSLNLELQQRACEYFCLLGDSWAGGLAPLFEKMPNFYKNIDTMQKKNNEDF